MMLHTSLIHLLVAVIAGCPLLCFAEATTLDRSGVDRACCAVCSNSLSESSHDAPSDDAPNSGGSDCLCHGAVVAAGLRHVEYDYTSLDFPVCAVASAQATVEIAISDAAKRSFSHFPPSCSGRDILALIESRLL